MNVHFFGGEQPVTGLHSIEAVLDLVRHCSVHKYCSAIDESICCILLYSKISFLFFSLIEYNCV